MAPAQEEEKHEKLDKVETVLNQKDDPDLKLKQKRDKRRNNKKKKKEKEKQELECIKMEIEKKDRRYS